MILSAQADLSEAPDKTDEPNDSTFPNVNVKRLLDRLLPEDRQAVELRYGIRDGVHRTLNATGSIIGCTAERVRQRIHRAIRRMRDVCNA
jgi:DNA-directed RNA polymerase sigma subunit (sigma70/sigma32)